MQFWGQTSKGHCSRPSNYNELSLSEIDAEFQCAGLVQVSLNLDDFKKYDFSKKIRLVLELIDLLKLFS